MLAVSATFNLTAADVTLTREKQLDATSASFTVTGIDVALETTGTIPADPAAIVVTAKDISFSRDYQLNGHRVRGS